MTLYVPERKVLTRQPHGRSLTVDWTNSITNGLEFAFSNSEVNLVDGSPISSTGTNIISYTDNLAGRYSSSAATVTTGTLKSEIPATGSVSVFMLARTRTTASRQRQLMLSGSVAASVFIDYGVSTSTHIALVYNGSTYPSTSFASFAANKLYATYFEHENGWSYPKLWRDGIQATTNSNGSTSARAGAIKTVQFGHGGLYPLNGDTYLCLVFSRLLSTDERLSLFDNPWQIFAPRRQWFAIGSTGNTLRVPFKTAAGADDNIYLTTDNTLRFNTAAGYYDPIAAITE